ncbi:hypothetical protein IB237_23875 [Agrobacterium sp. AGB01]|jgi:hypothetical protein|uniref:hypothetical protein n=1 Tax=Agrobacterium sp. AGB01 TaxID=2769302 RepID=UPI0017837B15|nr:hypothetical protein [Agrobacterium sp. AGB01]MBD9390243.1 hypothetical protein [Agrobacterium sp. AGB01]
MTINKEPILKTGRASAQDKASATDQAARQIIATDEAQRAKKTERLRLLREAQESATPVELPTVTKRKSRAKA